MERFFQRANEPQEDFSTPFFPRKITFSQPQSVLDVPSDKSSSMPHGASQLLKVFHLLVLSLKRPDSIESSRGSRGDIAGTCKYESINSFFKRSDSIASSRRDLGED